MNKNCAGTWVKASEDSPIENGSYFVRTDNGQGSLRFENGQWDTYNPLYKISTKIIEWLDPSPCQPSPDKLAEALEEAIKIFDNQALAHFDRESFMVMERMKSALSDHYKNKQQ